MAGKAAAIESRYPRRQRGAAASALGSPPTGTVCRGIPHRHKAPRTALFAPSLDADDSETRILHVFPDAAAVEQHFAGSDDRTSSVADFIIPFGYELYGPAPTSGVDQLHPQG